MPPNLATPTFTCGQWPGHSQVRRLLADTEAGKNPTEQIVAREFAGDFIQRLAVPDVTPPPPTRRAAP